IVGVLLVKDLVPLLLEQGRGDPDAPELRLRELMREPCFIPDGKPVSEALAELRAHGMHMAIVLDEFGGTEGIVTLEDLIEPIVGDIYDEYDIPEPEEFSLTADGDVLVDGGAGVDEVNARLCLQLPRTDFDTIGGLVFGQLGRLPRLGDEVAIEGALFRVEQLDERRIVRLRLRPRPRPSLPPRAEAAPEPTPAPSPAAAD
ncbi:MAG TPA: transporter associated domain-containing protein, partial [Longimicrobiales bacterium]